LRRYTTARRLLAMSVSGDNTRWVGWEDMPQRLQEQRSGPEVQVARGSGYTHVTRPGGRAYKKPLSTSSTQIFLEDNGMASHGVASHICPAHCEPGH
jgi:hypothetical protein